MKIAGEPAITLEIVSSIDALKHKNHPDLIVDAILGTGLESTVRAPMVPFIQWMNSCGAPILAIDVPSGLSADTGHVLGHCVNAHVTVTLAALKAGLLVENGPDVVGALHVVDIGVPAFEIDRVCSSTSEIRVSNDDFVRYRMPTPDRNNHKYTTGPCLIVGGSPSYAGAPVLASQAAARSGSGYVICIGPTSIRSLLQEKLTEIPVETWGIQPSASAAQDLITQLDTRWKKAKSLLIGPGLGSEEGLAEFIIALLLNHEGPAVIDADALGLLAGEKEWVQKHSRGRWIFTPHAGEFKKLQGSLDTDINMMEAAKRFAEEWNVVLLLKGFPSVVATPTGALIINSTGQSSAATAGSGDVLAGVIAGFLARGLSPSDAAICGIHVAGTATDLYVEENAAGTMMAGDILQLLPRVLSELQ